MFICMKDKFINTPERSSRQNAWCHFIDPADDIKYNWYLIDLYKIRDPNDVTPTDEIYETVTEVEPARTISASGSWACTVSMSGSLWAATKTKTVSRKVWKDIWVGKMFRNDGKIVFDIPAENITVVSQDLAW